MLLQDKVAIVSGVGSGMGQNIALALAAQGADVVLGARNETALAGFKDEIESVTAFTMSGWECPRTALIWPDVKSRIALPSLS